MALHLEELAASWLRGNHGCVRCAHSGWYLQFSCNHSCRPVSRRGMRSACTLRGTSASYRPSLGGQPHHPDSPHSPVAALRKRGRLALSTALYSTSPPVLFHRWPPQLCKIPLMALPRNGYTIACHGKGWPTLWSICLQTQGGQLECSVGRPVRGADGNKDWERWTEGHHVIPGTSGGIDSFPISAYVSDALDHCYSPDQANSSSETPHKEEAIKRRKVDTDDRRRISEELDKCSHPLEIESDLLYNIVNGQVATAVVNVSDALSLGALMVTDFRKSLPAGFHAKPSSPVKSMEKLKHGIKIADQVVFDLESIFLRLLLVGQQREMELLPIFGYELCAVPL